MYQGLGNVCFSENLACFVSLLPPFWDSPLCLITDDLCITCFSNHLCHFVSYFGILQSAIVYYIYIKALVLCCSALMIAVAKRSDIAKALIKHCSNKTLFNQQNVKGQVSSSYFMIFYEYVINIFMLLVASKVTCSHRNTSVALSCGVAQEPSRKLVDFIGGPPKNFSLSYFIMVGLYATSLFGI